MRAFLRIPNTPNEIIPAQARATAILLGRWLHLKNLHFNVWLPPLVAERYQEPPQRSDCTIQQVSIREWLRMVGPRGWLEIAEDLVGVRACAVARRLSLHVAKKRRFGRWLRRVAAMDVRQDFKAFDQACEKPKVSFCIPHFDILDGGMIPHLEANPDKWTPHP